MQEITKPPVRHNGQRTDGLTGIESFGLDDELQKSSNEPLGLSERRKRRRPCGASSADGGFEAGSRTEHYFQNFQGSGFEHEQGKRSSPGFLVTNRSTGAYKFMNQGYKKTRLRTRKPFSSLPEAMRMPAGEIDL